MRLKSSRNKYLTVRYVELMGYRCANPDCESGFGVEGHHITPIGKGGDDLYWNIVSLCSNCHDMKGLHSSFEAWKTKLFAWKVELELKVLGFVMDEQEPDFRSKCIKKMKELAGREYLKDCEVDSHLRFLRLGSKVPRFDGGFLVQELWKGNMRVISPWNLTRPGSTPKTTPLLLPTPGRGILARRGGRF
jgi:hypothetical protein